MAAVGSLSCAAHCPAVHVYIPERGEGISQGIYYKWSKDFMEAGKRRLSADTARVATNDEVKDLRKERLYVPEAGQVKVSGTLDELRDDPMPTEANFGH